jgi:hypothetical protein
MNESTFKRIWVGEDVKLGTFVDYDGRSGKFVSRTFENMLGRLQDCTGIIEKFRKPEIALKQIFENIDTQLGYGRQ